MRFSFCLSFCRGVETRQAAPSWLVPQSGLGLYVGLNLLLGTLTHTLYPVITYSAITTAITLITETTLNPSPPSWSHFTASKTAILSDLNSASVPSSEPRLCGTTRFCVSLNSPPSAKKNKLPPMYSEEREKQSFNRISFGQGVQF